MCVHWWAYVKMFVNACACEYVRIYANVACLHLCMYVYVWVLANECIYDVCKYMCMLFLRWVRNFRFRALQYPVFCSQFIAKKICLPLFSSKKLNYGLLAMFSLPEPWSFKKQPEPRGSQHWNCGRWKSGNQK